MLAEAAEPRRSARRRLCPWLMLAAAVVAAALAVYSWRTGSRKAPAVFTPVGAEAGATNDQPAPLDDAARRALRLEAWRRVQAPLEQTDAAVVWRIGSSVELVEEFFRHARAGAPAFAREVLSLRGKWLYVRGRLPLADNDEHSRFLRESFQRNVLRPDDLRAVVESAAALYLGDAAALENDLLVRIRADLADLPPEVAPCGQAVDWEDQFHRLCAQMGTQLAGDVQVTIGREAGSLVVGEMATAIALRSLTVIAGRLGVSSGVLVAGAESAWVTLGVGLVAAVVVDIGIDWGLQQAGYDPQERVVQAVEENLDRLRDLVLDGDADARQACQRLRQMARDDPIPELRRRAAQVAADIERSGRTRGLRQELALVAEAQAYARREALRTLILQAPEETTP